MPLIRDNRDQFGRLIAATAEGLDLDPSLVEKDYWAVEALRALHNGFTVRIDGDDVHIQPIFKGGTSLSRAHGLIQRFSEDVDLLVPVPIEDPYRYSLSQRTDVLRATTVTTGLSAVWVAETAADADRWSAKGNYPSTPRPDEGFAASPAFADPPLTAAVASSYSTALDWVWGEKPALDDCFATIQARFALL